MSGPGAATGSLPEPEEGMLLHHDRPLKTLSICNIDGMAYKLLLPWLMGMMALKADVHVACSCGPYAGRLREQGITVHDIPMRRSWNPFAHLRAVAATVKLLRKTRFDVVVVHSAVGATVGRIAAMLTGRRPVIHCVHGMMTTEHTDLRTRVVFYVLEKSLSFVTDSFHFVSQEDLVFARRSRLLRPWHYAAWGCGGVSADDFHPDPVLRKAVRDRLGLSERSTLVGIVARVVREKGFVEFFQMAKAIGAQDRDARFIVVGDTLPSDRDGIGAELRRCVEEEGLADRFIFTGMTDAVKDYLAAMDIFVLPTYREGFPRSVLEAMAVGLPVVATDVRGCREAIIPGETGLIVPMRDSVALTEAVLELVSDRDRARRMGEAGRQRLVANFEMGAMTKRYLDTVRRTVRPKAPGNGRVARSAAVSVS